MSFHKKLNERQNCNEVVFEAYGKIDQEFKTSNRGVKAKNEIEDNLSKKLPFFLSKEKKKEKTCDFLMNISDQNDDVQFVSKIIKSYMNISEPLRVRLSLLYTTGQYDLFRNYIIAIKTMMKGFLVLKVSRNGNIKKRKVSFNSYYMTIIGNWSRKILLYDEITQINIGNSCTPELRIFEKKVQDYENRMNYVVLRTLYRDYSFLFITDDEILMRIKNISALGKLKNLLAGKDNMLKKTNDLNVKRDAKQELKDNSFLTSEGNYDDITKEKLQGSLKNIHQNDVILKDEKEDVRYTIQGFKYFFLSVIRSIKTKNVNIEIEKVKGMFKKSNMLYFDKYDFKNTKINSFFLFCQIALDICGPEVWFTSKFDEILFTRLN
ncbi:hypothetical protein MKS88_004102 [Plasmodium brasilianum]|uniref:Uncharacterized protein n=1 Tax=Plasmodium brasilianum TaxID=5824 RepID=A0ACB9Y3V0_PLABR|nr:hypothetical protein MKS88_004102 [Plasmodium brasilianum]